MNEPLFEVVDGIKIYDGTTQLSRLTYTKKINYLKSLLKSNEQLFTNLQPSTLTAQGAMTNVTFYEKDIIDMLSDLPPNILMVGCNFGEKFNPEYKAPVPKKTSGRGRKPKEKVKSKRKVQGNGKYFSSQITSLISHPDTQDQYKIKLFRNGVFQVPGIRNPSMHDLVKPIDILREYLAYNFAENVQVVNFRAVMRNYKSRLINQHYHVNLEKLEEIILREKINPSYEKYLNNMLFGFSEKHKEKIKDLLGNYNPMNIAEMTYNTDRCFCLIIKFYRPSVLDPSKKITVKLLKKGKINFDGGNSQQEVEELYYWLQYIYSKHKDQILFDIRNIKNEYDSDTSDCDEQSIYDSSSDSDSDTSEEAKSEDLSDQETLQEIQQEALQDIQQTNKKIKSVKRRSVPIKKHTVDAVLQTLRQPPSARIWVKSIKKPSDDSPVPQTIANKFKQFKHKSNK